MNLNLEYAKSLPRDEIIKIAHEKIIESGFQNFSPDLFDRIIVGYNSESVFVSFQMSLRFVPFNSCYGYEIYYDIVNQYSSWQPICSNNQSDSRRIFFIADEETEREIAGLIEFLNIELPLPTYLKVTIIEEEEYYQYQEMSASYAYFFKINKITKEIYDEVEEELAVEEDSEEEFTEIME